MFRCIRFCEKEGNCVRESLKRHLGLYTDGKDMRSEVSWMDREILIKCYKESI